MNIDINEDILDVKLEKLQNEMSLNLKVLDIVDRLKNESIFKEDFDFYTFQTSGMYIINASRKYKIDKDYPSVSINVSRDNVSFSINLGMWHKCIEGISIEDIVTEFDDNLSSAVFSE